MELIALVVLLGASLALNVLAAVHLRRSTREHAAELEAAKKKPTPTLSAEQLLHDLTSGSAVIRVEVVNPADLFLRSPRA